MTKDNINPSHYKKGKIEAIDAIEAAVVGKSGPEAINVANVIKYLWRYEDKNGLEDVRKAKWYLERLITVLEEMPVESNTRFVKIDPTKTEHLWSKL